MPSPRSTAPRRAEAFSSARQKLLPGPFLPLQQTQPLTDDFAGGLVSAAGDAALDELFQLGRERDVELDRAAYVELLRMT